jgi:hypothetical protein
MAAPSRRAVLQQLPLLLVAARDPAGVGGSLRSAVILLSVDRHVMYRPCRLLLIRDRDSVYAADLRQQVQATRVLSCKGVSKCGGMSALRSVIGRSAIPKKSLGDLARRPSIRGRTSGDVEMNYPYRSLGDTPKTSKTREVTATSPAT